MWSAQAELAPFLGGGGSFRSLATLTLRFPTPTLRFGEGKRKLRLRNPHCLRPTHRLSPFAFRPRLDDNPPVSCYMTRRSARSDRAGVS